MLKLDYTAKAHEGITRCWCGCKYWEERTTSGKLSVFCVSCDMDLNETLPGIKRGTAYGMNDDGDHIRLDAHDRDCCDRCGTDIHELQQTLFADGTVTCMPCAGSKDDPALDAWHAQLVSKIK